MLNLLIICLTLIMITVIGCITAIRLQSMYYQDQTGKRLERFDQLLHNPELVQIEEASSTTTIEDIVKILNKRCTTSTIGMDIVNLFEKKKLIPPDRADYIKS